MMHIQNTGQRILLDKETPLMIARHFCAYKFAKDYVNNKRVLDIGCGEGYGSNYLAGFAKEVVGIDYDKEIIDYAKSKYKKDNLTFFAIDAKEMGTLKDKFDIICSFQVIEHIKDTKLFLKNINDLIKDSGIFICSTPNKLDASPDSATPLNKFHMKEYLLNEFEDLLKIYFSTIDVLGLKRGCKLNFYRRLKKIGLFNFLHSEINPVDTFYKQIDCDNFDIVTKRLHTALDFIAVCKK